jgi:AraC-like DNA-binding protein
VSMQGGHFIPVPFSTMIDAQTGRTRIRLVDINSTRYAIARRYMIRLRRDDFDDPTQLARLASAAKLTEGELRRQFEHIVKQEPPPLLIDEQGEKT